MPTILSHPAVPLAVAYGLGRSAIPGRLLAAGVFASILPDCDVAAFYFHVPYAASLAHRGFSHSVACALVVALAGAGLHRWFRTTFWRAGLFLFAAMASHGVLDAFTTGGSGVAFWWPWSEARYFFPVQMIEVSPLGVSRFLSWRGLKVLVSEFVWVWLPLFSVTALAAAYRRRRG